MKPKIPRLILFINSFIKNKNETNFNLSTQRPTIYKSLKQQATKAAAKHQTTTAGLATSALFSGHPYVNALSNALLSAMPYS